MGDADRAFLASPPLHALVRAPPVVAHGFRSSAERSEALALNDSECAIDADTQAMIRSTARRIIGRPGHHSQDRDDLTQSLTVRFLERRAAFDSARGRWLAFVTQVVGRQAANLVRDASAQCRDSRRVQSLDMDQAPGGIDQRQSQSDRAREDRTDLALDLSEVLGDLPPDLRRVAERLMHDSVAQTARDLGLPRSEVRRAMARLRARLINSGIQQYL